MPPRPPLSLLITGAGSGFGRALADRFSNEGAQVFATVRSEPRARQLTEAAQTSGRPIHFFPLELSDRAQIARLAQDVEALGGLDVLIQNAGFGIFGPVEAIDADAALRQLTVNLLGPLELTRLLLPSLRKRRGRVFFVGSLAGRIALPFQAHYSASKAALAAMSDALRMELRPFGVQVTCVEPGDFSTGFTDARRLIHPEGGSPYEAALGRCLANIEAQERGGASPELLARAVSRLVRTRNPPARAPIGPNSKAICTLLRFLPDALRERMVRHLYGV